MLMTKNKIVNKAISQKPSKLMKLDEQRKTLGNQVNTAIITVLRQEKNTIKSTQKEAIFSFFQLSEFCNYLALATTTLTFMGEFNKCIIWVRKLGSSTRLFCSV